MGRVAVVTGGALGIGLGADVSDRAAVEKALDASRSEFPPRAVITPMFMAAPFAPGPAGEENIRRLAAEPGLRYRPGQRRQLHLIFTSFR